MFECQATEKQCRRRVSERKEIFPNANKFHAKRELAMKCLHNIGAGHTVERFNFNRKMVCQHHVTVDLEHRLLGFGERRLVNENTVPTECVHRKKSSGRAVLLWHAKSGLAKGTNIMYANTINGVLEYNSMYFLYYNKNQ